MSLYILDTDTLSLLQHGHIQVQQHALNVSSTELATTIITVEEQLTGWYAALRRARDATDLARAYQRMTTTVQTLSQVRILSFTEEAILRYNELVALKLNIGKMDLRIAAVALNLNAIVVTRNIRDFSRVPGLSVEDWSL